jgi:hypothetical protein
VERHAILDERLVGSPEIYFGAGDHVALVHVSGNDFLKLMADAPRRQDLPPRLSGAHAGQRGRHSLRPPRLPLVV